MLCFKNSNSYPLPCMRCFTLFARDSEARASPFRRCSVWFTIIHPTWTVVLPRMSAIRTCLLAASIAVCTSTSSFGEALKECEHDPVACAVKQADDVESLHLLQTRAVAMHGPQPGSAASSGISVASSHWTYAIQFTGKLAGGPRPDFPALFNLSMIIGIWVGMILVMLCCGDVAARQSPKT